MRSLTAMLTLVTLLMVIGGLAIPGPADAGSDDAALALGAFAVFNQLVRGETVLHDSVHRRRERVIVHHAPPPIYAPPVVVAPPPPPPVVVYPHGQWIAHNGHWIWVPNGYGAHSIGYGHKHHKKYWRHDKRHYRHHDYDH